MARRSDLGSLLAELPASEQTRQRLEVMVETLQGHIRVAQACSGLGIGRTRFQDLRKRVLEAALGALEARPAGRPRRPRPPSTRARDALRARIVEIEGELARTKAELELVRKGLDPTMTARRLAKAVRS